MSNQNEFDALVAAIDAKKSELAKLESEKTALLVKIKAEKRFAKMSDDERAALVQLAAGG